MTGIIHEWRRLSDKFADTNGWAYAAAEEAKAAMQVDAERGIPYSPLTVAKFDRAVDLLAEARLLITADRGAHEAVPGRPENLRSRSHGRELHRKDRSLSISCTLTEPVLGRPVESQHHPVDRYYGKGRTWVGSFRFPTGQPVGPVSD